MTDSILSEDSCLRILVEFKKQIITAEDILPRLVSLDRKNEFSLEPDEVEFFGETSIISIIDNVLKNHNYDWKAPDLTTAKGSLSDRCARIFIFYSGQIDSNASFTQCIEFLSRQKAGNRIFSNISDKDSFWRLIERIDQYFEDLCLNDIRDNKILL